MEDEDQTNSSNQFNVDGCQNLDMQELHGTNYPRKRNHTQLSPISQSSQTDAAFLDQLFWYDIRNLPDSVIIEILARLPVKSIFRFKCVSKHWQTLISHCSFRRLFSSILDTYTSSSSSSSMLPFRILYRYVYVSKFKELLNRIRPQIYNSSKFSVLFLSSIEEHQQRDLFKILGVSNGLILCCLLGPLIYYVCDPVTRQWITLPRGRCRPQQIIFGEGFVSRVNQDNVVTSYRVVTVDLLNTPSNYFNLETFSSETGEWVGYRLLCAIPFRLMKRGGGPINFNGILHWFVHDHGMVAFDPYKDPKSCRIIQFPDDRNLESEYKHDEIYRLCDECQGVLRYFEVAPEASEFYCFSMWVMNDYEKGEWRSEFKVTRSDLYSNDPELSGWLLEATFLPLSFHPLDLNIVYLRCIEVGCIVSFDVQHRRLDVACKPIGVVDDLSWRVVTPFVLPRWPMPFPNPPIPILIPKKTVKPKPLRHNRHFRVYRRQ